MSRKKEFTAGGWGGTPSHLVECDFCGENHPAEPAHVSKTQGQMYAVICPHDGLTDYYTSERVEEYKP